MVGQRLEQARGPVGVVTGGTGDGGDALEEVLVGREVTKVEATAVVPSGDHRGRGGRSSGIATGGWRSWDVRAPPRGSPSPALLRVSPSLQAWAFASGKGLMPAAWPPLGEPGPHKDRSGLGGWWGDPGHQTGCRGGEGGGGEGCADGGGARLGCLPPRPPPLALTPPSFQAGLGGRGGWKPGQKLLLVNSSDWSPDRLGL